MQKEFFTILKEAVIEIQEKKSRFIASAKPVSTEEEAQEFISLQKTKYWNATHNVYAYFIDGEIIAQKFSDDGEPSGTAGMPILEVIKRVGVQNLVIVVTRFFGGTLLGATGLVRAYGKSASLAIETAKIIKKALCTEVRIILEYALWGRVENLLQTKGYPINNVCYEQDVDVFVSIPVDEVEAFLGLIDEETNGRAIIDSGEKMYVTIKG